jgi:hypothetical protein
MHFKKLNSYRDPYLHENGISSLIQCVMIGGVLLLLAGFATSSTCLVYQNLPEGVEPQAPQEEEGRKKDSADIEEEASGEKSPEEEKSLMDSVSIDEVKEQIRKDWEKLLETFKKEGISLDKEKKRIDVKGAIVRDARSANYPIEYVVVSDGGNTHEALILIKATPSVLNAALLSLGLNPGKTISSRLKDPPPSKEDVDSGKESPYEIIPPTGRKVYIYVSCETWKERPIRFLEDLLLDQRTGRPMERVGWIYVGSRFAQVLQGRKREVKFMADMERNIVASYLKGFGNCIFDLNSTEGINDSLLDVNPDDALPIGSKITLTFSLDPL